jgi:CRISPR-associated protein Cmr2
MDIDKNKLSIAMAYAWCLAWGDGLQPQVDLKVLHQMREAMAGEGQIPEAVRAYVDQAQKLDGLTYPKTLDALKTLVEANPELWDSKIGLVYGGATKIKQYVFEAAKLQDIRGASALLDRINLVDLPAFFHGEDSDRFPQCQRSPEYCKQVRDRSLGATDDSLGLAQALIPELIVYSTGSNILAFCPSAYVHLLANAIEKRYTQETLTANSCAVGERFRFLELRFGLLKDPIEQTNWLEWYQQNASEHLVEAYYGEPGPDLAAQFEQRHSFNQLVGKLSNRFSQRRSGHDWPAENRPSRRYPPMYETHPYVRRDTTDKRSAVRQVPLPNSPWLSEPAARKLLVGRRAKREDPSNAWFSQAGFSWDAGPVESWVQRYESFLRDNPRLSALYDPNAQAPQEARSLREVGNPSKGFVAYIYADGNSMGGFIKQLTTAEDYQKFSDVVSQATEQSVYQALAHHLHPHRLQGINDAETQNRDGNWVHPFEILTIGGDDVMLVVPADQALAIAKTISEEFERILLKLSRENDLLNLSFEVMASPRQGAHRYRPTQATTSQCQLSMSVGVLIAADDTPIYYAENLTSQLLKSTKKKAKALKDTFHYHGGTIDFLVMKSVTMLSSKIEEFRESGLVIDGKPKLKLYGAPYTLHEIGGLLETAKALKAADFPRSQLYQIRSLLERGKHTAMLNYRYFRVRLAKDKQALLEENFETAWCLPKDNQNGGNLAPWMSLQDDAGTTYETIWRELVDLYPFTDEPDQTSATTTPATQEVR